MNKIIIIGGGLTGLSCAIKLIENNIEASNIIIFEARQEIVSPTRSPWIALDSKNINLIFNKIKLQPLTFEKHHNKLISFRREWLETIELWEKAAAERSADPIVSPEKLELIGEK